MPTRAPSICGCGRSIPSGQACPCSKARKAEHDARRPSSAARGYDHAFRRATAGYLDAHPRCACGAKATAVGHIASIRSRPDLRLEPTNWKPICRGCNRREAHVEAKDRGVVANIRSKGGDRSGSTARIRPEMTFLGSAQK